MSHESLVVHCPYFFSLVRIVYLCVVPVSVPQIVLHCASDVLIVSSFTTFGVFGALPGRISTFSDILSVLVVITLFFFLPELSGSLISFLTHPRSWPVPAFPPHYPPLGTYFLFFPSYTLSRLLFSFFLRGPFGDFYCCFSSQICYFGSVDAWSLLS